MNKAWTKHNKHPSEKTSDSHVEAAKDAAAFSHLLEIVEHMSAEITDLRMELAAVAEFDDEQDHMSVVGPPRSKRFLN